jgi:hypothetical protein
MAFPVVCAIAVVGIETADAVKIVNAMAAKVENVVRGKRRMLACLFLNDQVERSGACLSQRSLQNQPGRNL